MSHLWYFILSSLYNTSSCKSEIHKCPRLPWLIPLINNNFVLFEGESIFPPYVHLKKNRLTLEGRSGLTQGFASDLSFIRWKSSYDVTDPIEFWWPTTDGSRELFKSYRFLTFIYFNIDFWILYWINNIVVLIYEIINIWIFMSRFLSHFNERKVLRKNLKYKIIIKYI